MAEKIKTQPCSICGKPMKLQGELYFEKVKRFPKGTAIIVCVWCANCEIEYLERLLKK